MSGRYSALGDGPLTDEQLDGMERWGEEDLPIYARVCGPRAARELRARRAADLTSAETESLRTAHAVLSDSQLSAWGSLDEKRRALAALSRLILTHDTEHKP